jgi:malonyl-CoA/methylmalonyl-CoA synthetase
VAGTVGFALPGVEVRIRDAQGHDLERGDIGGIEVRGPNIFKGYWNMPEKTAEDFTADGWFKTGDVGQMDSHGRLTIVGRSKDLIISGGYNVYPAEVESFLNEMPGVAESAVVGVAHPDFGEAVVAVVIPKPAAHLESASMIEALKSKIARFKVPKQLFVLEDLPRNAMGKVQKNVLRDRYKGLFAA